MSSLKQTQKALTMMPVAKLRPSATNPRRSLTLDQANRDPEMCALVESLKHKGVLEPLLVRPSGEILAGERRWTAAQIVGLIEVPVIVLECSDADRLDIIFAENVHRKDLAPTELATLLAEMGTQGVSDEEIARRTSISTATVGTYKAVYRLPREIWPLIDSGELPLGQAKEIGKLTTDAQKIAAAKRAVDRRLTTREVKASVQTKLPTAKAQLGYAERRQRDIAWAMSLLIEIRTRLEQYRDMEDIPPYAEKIENRLQSVSRDVFTLHDEIGRRKLQPVATPSSKEPQSVSTGSPMKFDKDAGLGSERGLKPDQDHKSALRLFNSMQRERFAQLIRGRTGSRVEWEAVDAVLRETATGTLSAWVRQEREQQPAGQK